MPLICKFRHCLWILPLLIAGCGGMQQIPEQAYTTGENYSQRAAQELALAATAPSPQKEHHQVAAADAYFHMRDFSAAQALLAPLDYTVLRLPELATYALLSASIATHEARYFDARDFLATPPLESQWQQLPVDLQRRWREQRGDLYASLGDDTGSVTEYRALVRLLKKPERIAAVHEKIWQILLRTPEQTIAQLLVSTTDTELKGWYQLVQTWRASGDNQQLQDSAVSAWRQHWSTHPVAIYPPASMGLKSQPASIAQPQPQQLGQLALLLPLQGAYGEAGAVIRDGFLAAWYSTNQQGGAPPVLVYDTGAGNVIDVYQRALNEGAQMVVGPLRKEDVATLAALPELPVPTIALNYLEEVESLASGEPGGSPATSIGASAPIPTNLYQFGLSIADEAYQIADRAWLQGHRSALTITADTSWGNAALRAFRNRWLARGGTLISLPPYAANERDFSPQLAQILLIDQSKQRADRLQRTLGKNLESAPRRRQDIDMVLLIANTDQGRQIKPTLDFLYASDLPVYATSLIYVGTPDQNRDQDLSGIQFSAMPWSLPGKTPGGLQAGSSVPPAYRQLFALGSDAYQLHQWITVMDGSAQLDGYTGTLTLGADHRVLQQQQWAEFRNGKVYPVRGTLER